MRLPRPASSGCALLLVACASAKTAAPVTTPEAARASREVAAQLDPSLAARPREANPEGPVTHAGRNVLPLCHRMVVATVAVRTPDLRGAQVVRIEEDELLWGPPRDRDEGPTYVSAGEAGVLPAPGAKALFLLRLLPSGNYEAIEVAPLGDMAGPARLAAFRKILEIEALPTGEARRAALLAHLRESVRTGDAWTRDHAIREYAAFADAFPRSLTPADGETLAAALPKIREATIRRLAEKALDATGAGGRATASSRLRLPALAAADLSPYEPRVVSKNPKERRDAVIDASAVHGPRAAPLVVRLLADPDPIVREAAYTSAGENGMKEAAEPVAAALDREEHPLVRRAVVTALGKLRVGTAVPRLGALAVAEGVLSRESAYALGRIRDDAARAELAKARAATKDAERGKLLDFLLSDDFVRQEKALGEPWSKAL